MPELTVDDVIQYTGGRLEYNDETARILEAALAAARRYCGWHVTPVRTDDAVTIDGPGDPLLILPTLQIVDVIEVTEDGATLALADLTWSTAPRARIVQKKSGMRWSNAYSAIVVTMDHGFTETEAADWRDAVLSAVNSASLQIAGRQTAGPFTVVPQSSLFSEAEQGKLDPYRLLNL